MVLSTSIVKMSAIVIIITMVLSSYCKDVRYCNHYCSEMVLSTSIVKMSAIVIIITVEVAVKWSSQPLL